MGLRFAAGLSKESDGCKDELGKELGLWQNSQYLLIDTHSPEQFRIACSLQECRSEQTFVHFPKVTDHGSGLECHVLSHTTNVRWFRNVSMSILIIIMFQRYNYSFDDLFLSSPTGGTGIGLTRIQQPTRA